MVWSHYSIDRTMSNEELYIRSIQGDHTSREQLFINNLPLIQRFAKKWKYNDSEFEELLSIGCVAYQKAYNTFDINKGYKFSTWLVKLVVNDLINHIKQKNRKKNKKYESISIDKEIEESDDTLHDFIASDDGNILARLDDSIDVKEALDKFNSVANEREKYIIKKVYFEGVSLTDIAKEWNLTRATTSLIHRRCLEKMKRLIEKRAV